MNWYKKLFLTAELVVSTALGVSAQNAGYLNAPQPYDMTIDYGTDYVNLYNAAPTIKTPMIKKNGLLPFSFDWGWTQGCKAVAARDTPWYCDTIPYYIDGPNTLMDASVGFTLMSAPCNGGPSTNYLQNFYITTPDGAYHSIGGAIYTSGCGTTSYTGTTVDNTGYTLVITGGAASPTITIYDKSGKQ